MDYIKMPMDIEKRSFEIIGEEMGELDFPERELSIVKRVIHTTAAKKIEKLDLQLITVRGRKGGSTVAATIINALMYMFIERN